METKYIKEPVTWVSDDEVDPGFVPLECEPFIVRENGETKLHMGDGETPGGYLIARQSPDGMSSVIDTVQKPQVLAPLDGALDVVASPILVSSTYMGSGVVAGEEHHIGSIWQIATDSGFNELVYDGGLDVVNLTQLDLEVMDVSLPNGIYYARVQYEASGGIKSVWSNSVTFTVAVNDYTVGDLVNGDIVVGETETQWILAAPASYRANLEFGLTGEDLLDLEMGDVTSLTAIAAGLGSPAALHCQSQGYALPDTTILAKMYQNATALDAADTSGGEITIASLIGGADLNLGRAWSVHSGYSAGSGNVAQYYLSFTAGVEESTAQRQWQLAVVPVRMIDK